MADILLNSIVQVIAGVNTLSTNGKLILLLVSKRQPLETLLNYQTLFLSLSMSNILQGNKILIVDKRAPIYIGVGFLL